MWGRYYWGPPIGSGGVDGCAEEAAGIVVVFAWLSSSPRQVGAHVALYAGARWASLVCHPQFVTVFFPEKVELLAKGILRELGKVLEIRPVPVVFAAFSGGPLGCMYKVLQLIQKDCLGQQSLKEYQLVRDCLCGQIYDSCPVDFTSEFGTRFALHPSVLKVPAPPRFLSWTAKAFASSLDALFINRFEAQRAEYWQALYSSANFGPILICCSEIDEFVPIAAISEFACRLRELGGNVKMVKWDDSPHVGHYKRHPNEYRASVLRLLNDATASFLSRKQPDGNSSPGDDPKRMTEPRAAQPHSGSSHSDNPERLSENEENDRLMAELFHVMKAPKINLISSRGVAGIISDVGSSQSVKCRDLNPLLSRSRL